MAEAADPNPLAAAVAEAHIVVCVGTGGVGKTTTAAALGLAAARAGRRAVVVTVDPARRLAHALGLDDLGNEPRLVEGAGAEGGSLHAAMLDPRATFDAMIVRCAAGPAQRERILTNRFYQNLAGNLSGTHEYMAMEKLHELATSGAYDLVVVDTPPTRDALAFLDAPRLFARLLDNWLYKLLVLPGRGLARTAAAGAHTLVRQLTRVAGTSVVDDTIAFFRALDGIEEGFRTRANEVYRTLQSPHTAFVLVVSPRPDALADAEGFAGSLARAGMVVRAVVVNRLTPTFGDVEPPPGARSGAARALADFRRLAAREAAEVAAFAAAVPDAPLVRVPLLAHDVHDLDGLGTIAGLLTGPDLRTHGDGGPGALG
jgi:anion-transporting  ArsA/GET3 family ATPase